MYTYSVRLLCLYSVYTKLMKIVANGRIAWSISELPHTVTWIVEVNDKPHARGMARTAKDARAAVITAVAEVISTARKPR